MVQESIKYDWYGEEMDNRKLSIQFEEVLESEKQLATYFEILDVFKKSNTTYLLIDMFDFIFELKVYEKDLPKILDMSKLDIDEYHCILIVSIDELNKNKHRLIENENLSDLDVSLVRYFGKGDLLDIKCLPN